MSNFLEFIKNKSTKIWLEELVRHAELVLEMAVIGDKAKTPILFDWDDIRYLYQFPPVFWKKALTMRYNKFLLEAKRAKEEGKQYPDEQKVTLRKGRGVYTFHVDTKINDLLEKLEKDKDLGALNKLGTHPEDRAKYQGGHYGYDISNPKFHPEEEDQNFANGYKAMADQTANRALQDWRHAMRTGWLGNTEGFPMGKVSFGGGRGQKKDVIKPMPILTGDKLAKFIPENKITKDHEVIWTYEDEKGNLKTVQSHLPLLLPGKLIQTRDLKKHEELMKLSKQAQEQGDMDKANALKGEAKQLQQGADKYTPYHWNVHRYNTELDPDNPKRKKYKRLHTNVRRFGGFHPNAQQAELLVDNKDIWDVIEPYIIDPRGNDTGIDQGGKLQGDQSIEAFDEDGNEITIPFSPIQMGVAKFFKSISGTYEYGVLNSMFNDIVQSAILELREQLREPTIKRFTKALEDGDTAMLGRAYRAMSKNIQNKAFNFAQRVSQLNWGRGTRRLRKPATEGIVSIQNSFASGENDGKDTVELGNNFVNRLSTLGIEGSKGAGQRKWRTAGGRNAPEEIYFGHNLANLEDNLAALMDKKQINIDQKNAKGELQNDKEIRKEIFQQLWSLYIATQIKMGKPWSVGDANKFADAKLKEVLIKRGMKVSQVPPKLLASLSTKKDASKDAARLAQQEQDKEEILAAVGRESEMGGKADKAEKEIFDPKTIEFLKKNPAALQNAEKMIDQESDPVKKDQMRDIIDRIKGEMGLGMKVAAKQQEPTTAPGPIAGGNQTIYTPKLAQRLAQDPASLERIRNNPQMMSQKVWQQAVATADELIKGGRD